MKKVRLVILLLLLATFTLSAQSWKNILSDYCIVDILEYEHGYWLATSSHGALRYDEREKEWYYYKKDNGYMTQSDDVNDMLIANNRVWFATNYGIHSCKLDGSDWDHDILPGGVYSNWVRGFSANSDSLFVASFTGLLTKPFSTKSYKVHDNLKPDNYQTSYTNSVFATDTIVWIGTDDGVFRYDASLNISDPASVTYYSKNAGIPTSSDLVMCRSLLVNEYGFWLGLDEYTSIQAPNYCRGGLFNFSQGAWTKYEESTGLPADGIHFIQSHGSKIYAGLFHYVDGVNFEGAGLLELDQNDGSWSVLDKSNWFIGSNQVRSFFCNETDTIVGTDQGIYTNIEALPGFRPFAQPKWFSLRHIGNGEIEVRVDSVYRANGFKLYHAYNGNDFTDTLYIDSVCDTLKSLALEQSHAFKIAGKNDYGVGPCAKDVLSIYMTDEVNEILIVQAFDMALSGNTYDFPIQHGQAISNSGLGYDSMSDEALMLSNIAADDYKCIDWICGLDNGVFLEEERTFARAFLEAGGKLFVSGAQIVENLSLINKDEEFYKNYLKAKVKNGKAKAYLTENVSSSLLNGVAPISFDDGTHDIYKVFAPDGFAPQEGAAISMYYSGLDTLTYGCAGIEYTGKFGDSELEGQLVYFGFPFESIYPDSMQGVIMKSVLNYFDFEVELTAISPQEIVSTYRLDQNYPNPFNPSTRIRIEIPQDDFVELSVYDLQGKKIQELIKQQLSAGSHFVDFNAANLPSGIYIAKFNASTTCKSVKMLLMK